MAAERNDFNINLGDTIYSDSELAGAAVARTVAEKWGKYRLGLALPALRRLRASAGLYSHWDDHEFVNDFSRAENGGAMYAAGVKAFTDYAPVAKPSAATGLYRTFRWGANLELFFLDERTFRSAKADDACSGDLAPTVPQAVRDAFATLAPGLRNPVAPGCLAALNDPSRTLLGARQYAAFTKAIKASKATWKVVVNEVPIQQYYALPYDRWEGYAAERERLLRFLQANVRNVVFLTTDTHGNLVNEVRYRTLGNLESSVMWEVVTGPVATNTFAKEIDGYLGQKGAGTAIGALFFKPAPPNGLGMRCAALDTYSYAEVTVTAKRLTVAMNDAKGRPVREATGTACAPLVLTAR
jgi:alkaline phosphatase D